MIEELNAVRALFETTLENYFIQCSDTQVYYSLQNATRDVSLRRMDAEIALLASYESKLREARRIIGEARNYSFNLTPINMLPSEILVHIFQLCIGSQPCHLKRIARSTERKPFLMYPGCFTHVCSRWRQIVITSPSFWVHIDLASCKSLRQSRAHINRVQTFAMRSGDLSLQIHIAEQEILKSSYDELYVNDLLHPLLNRIGDLELTVRGEIDRFQNSVLSTLMSGCHPQTFNKLVINTRKCRYNSFFGSTDDILDTEEANPYFRLPVLNTEFERSLRHVSILHLAGVFPKWTSVAYHGLVDLRLTSPHPVYRSSIDETALVNMLRVSPGMRILYLELEIANKLPDTIPITLVPLKHLEVLSVITDDYPFREDGDPPAEAGRLLRYFAPGSLPLRFTFQTADYANDRSFEEVKRFFMRSNIVKFCSRDAYPPLDELLSHAPNLRTLIFHECAQRNNSIDLVSQAYRNAAALHLGWDLWYIHFCRWIDIDDLSMIVRLYPKELVLAGCIVYRNLRGSRHKEEVPEEELSHMFPLVRFIGEEECHHLPEPTENWDVLD